jgi:hypothetical protein
VWVSAIVIAILASPASGQECDLPAPKGSSPFSYALTFIAADARIQRACEVALQNGQPPAAPGETIYQLKQAKQELGCARSALAPYVVGPESVVKSSAVIAVAAIDQLRDASDKEIAVYKSLLDNLDAVGAGRPTGLSSAQVADIMSDIGVQENAAWELLTKGTAGVFLTLVDQAAADAASKAVPTKKTGWQRLVITAAERRQLLLTLEEAFGAEVKRWAASKATNITSVQTAAGALYEAIASPTWKASDE